MESHGFTPELSNGLRRLIREAITDFKRSKPKTLDTWLTLGKTILRVKEIAKQQTGGTYKRRFGSLMAASGLSKAAGKDDRTAATGLAEHEPLFRELRKAKTGGISDKVTSVRYAWWILHRESKREPNGVEPQSARSGSPKRTSRRLQRKARRPAARPAATPRPHIGGIPKVPHDRIGKLVPDMVAISKAFTEPVSFLREWKLMEKEARPVSTICRAFELTKE
jgi:hypothetical protein